MCRQLLLFGHVLQGCKEIDCALSNGTRIGGHVFSFRGVLVYHNAGKDMQVHVYVMCTCSLRHKAFSQADAVVVTTVLASNRERDAITNLSVDINIR